MINAALRRVSGRAGAPPASAELAHALKNDVVGKVNHFGVMLENQLAAVHENLTQQLGLLGSRLGTVEDGHHRQAERLEEIAAEVDLVNRRMLELHARSAAITDADLGGRRVDPELAVMINRARSADGPLRERGLFMNGPLNIQWFPTGPELVEVNERIIEVPYAIARLAELAPGSQVLDVGGGESTLGLGLASRGHRVDLVEPGGVPFEHPNLTVHVAPIEEVDGLEPPDAIVLLSTIEHIGIGAYGHDTSADQDLEVMRLLWHRCEPGTRLVLTTPYGTTPAVDALQRTYDHDRLTRLLTGWTVDDARLAVQLDDHTWTEREGLRLDGTTGRAAALVSAVRAADADSAPW